jgi:hypothetical protein
VAPSSRYEEKETTLAPREHVLLYSSNDAQRDGGDAD